MVVIEKGSGGEGGLCLSWWFRRMVMVREVGDW